MKWSKVQTGISQKNRPKLEFIMGRLDIGQLQEAYRLCFSLQYLATDFENIDKLKRDFGKKETSWNVNNLDPNKVMIRLVKLSADGLDDTVEALAENGIENAANILEQDESIFGCGEFIEAWCKEYECEL